MAIFVKRPRNLCNSVYPSGRSKSDFFVHAETDVLYVHCMHTDINKTQQMSKNINVIKICVKFGFTNLGCYIFLSCLNFWFSLICACNLCSSLFESINLLHKSFYQYNIFECLDFLFCGIFHCIFYRTFRGGQLPKYFHGFFLFTNVILKFRCH